MNLLEEVPLLGIGGPDVAGLAAGDGEGDFGRDVRRVRLILS